MRENNSVVFDAREIFIVRSIAKLIVESTDINAKGKWKHIAISSELRESFTYITFAKNLSKSYILR